MNLQIIIHTLSNAIEYHHGIIREFQAGESEYHTSKCAEHQGYIDAINVSISMLTKKDALFDLELLTKNQQPLGSEFEEVWDKNVDNLYQP